jgi:hypothetical protein
LGLFGYGFQFHGAVESFNIMKSLGLWHDADLFGETGETNQADEGCRPI